MKPLKPFEPFKVDQKFKSPVEYGFHEGWDMNGLGGGNTDLGTPLWAVADGEVVHTSESTKDYGKLVVLHLKTANGERWVRYCHCNEIRIKDGLVRRGDVVATLGSTGNSTAAHLHFDVLKKQPSSWRYYGKENFDEYFEDPEIFFNTDLVDIISTPVELVITDQTKIPQIDNLQVDQIRSMLNDQKRDLANLQKDKETLNAQFNAALEANKLYDQRLREAEGNRDKYKKELEALENNKLGPFATLGHSIDGWFGRKDGKRPTT